MLILNFIPSMGNLENIPYSKSIERHCVQIFTMLYVYFIYSLWRNVAALSEYHTCRLLNTHVIHVYLVSNSTDIKTCTVHYITELFI